jgi:hypothetical protein
VEFNFESSVKGWEIPTVKFQAYAVANINGEITGHPFARLSSTQATLFPPEWKGLYQVVASDLTYTNWDQDPKIENYSSRVQYPLRSAILNLAPGVGVIALVYSALTDGKGGPRYFERYLNKGDDDPVEMALRLSIEPPSFERGDPNNRVYLMGGSLPLEVRLKPPTPNHLPLPHHTILLDQYGRFIYSPPDFSDPFS